MAVFKYNADAQKKYDTPELKPFLNIDKDHIWKLDAKKGDEVTIRILPPWSSEVQLSKALKFIF